MRDARFQVLISGGKLEMCGANPAVGANGVRGFACEQTAVSKRRPLAR
jgi:hypothetical protein